MTTPQKLATPAEVAAWLDITERQLAAMRQSETGPKSRRLGHRTVRYAWGDVFAYVAACKAKDDARP